MKFEISKLEQEIVSGKGYNSALGFGGSLSNIILEYLRNSTDVVELDFTGVNPRNSVILEALYYIVHSFSADLQTRITITNLSLFVLQSELSVQIQQRTHYMEMLKDIDEKVVVQNLFKDKN